MLCGFLRFLFALMIIADILYKTLGLNKQKRHSTAHASKWNAFLSSTDAGLGLTHLSVKKKSKEKGMSVP